MSSDPGHVAKVKALLAAHDGTRSDEVALLAGIAREQLDGVGGVKEADETHSLDPQNTFGGHREDCEGDRP